MGEPQNTDNTSTFSSYNHYSNLRKLLCTGSKKNQNPSTVVRLISLRLARKVRLHKTKAQLNSNYAILAIKSTTKFLVFH